MPDDLRYWRGKRIDQLTREELHEALVEVYRDLERLTWLSYQQRMIIERSGKTAKAHHKAKAEVIDVDVEA